MNTDTPKTVTELQTELALLKRELAECNALVASIQMTGATLQAQTTGHILGNVTATELLATQRKHDEALAAVQRQSLLGTAVSNQQQAINYAKAQERRAFFDKLGKDFIDTRERYQIESKKLLGIFKEMVRLNNVSLSMNSHQFLTEGDWRLDLPALRREADSELFTIGSMVRSGDL